ncbi:ATP-binding cassette domain-containing protein [Streptomyces jeddahensis]|uniref:Putative ABC transporter ATP-binding protein n=1 Tax=Streptomyces jeddahensis TaxID=1716141 RepID=A0A177HXE4_9ACTN|nr:ATP-binding cassette domain-containing protein [Streptomyces jeddahensis]OAH15602.1 putative ABC transporter ATP-binding protein [Streptomyces jeddahensis]
MGETVDVPHGVGVAVKAQALGLRGPRGWAYRGVDIDAEPGALIAIEGPSGSGRTSLLLTLTGRMRPTEGRASVGRFRLPKQMAAVRRISALGPVPGVTDLDPSLTVAEHLSERTLLQRRYDGSLRALLRSLLRPRAERAAEVRLRIESALSAAGLDTSALPKGTPTAVRDLERLEALRLSLALALIGRPGVLGVDDTDLKLSDAERAEAWALLRSIAEAGTTVVAVCSEAPEDVQTVSTASRTENPRTAPSSAPAPSDRTDMADDEKETADALAEAGRA